MTLSKEQNEGKGAVVAIRGREDQKGESASVKAHNPTDVESK